MQTSIQTIRSSDELSALRSEWEALVAKRADYYQCQTPVYVCLAIDHALQRGAEISVISTRNVTGLVGLWALALRREGLFRNLRPVSCGSYEDYSVPLVAPDVELQALDAIIGAALAIACDTICIMTVREHSALAHLLEGSPYAELPRQAYPLMSYEVGLKRFAKWEDYAAQTTKKHLKDRTRLMRRLSEKGNVELGWCRTPADAEFVLTWIFDTKAKWARQRRIETSWLKDRRLLDFWIALSREVDLNNMPLITYLKLDGQPIAASVNLIGGSSLEYFTTTYDENYSRFSPGEQLIEFCLKWCIENRKNFDLRPLPGDYKERIADRKTLVSSYAVYLSPKARLLSRPLSMLTYTLRRARRAPGKLLTILQRTVRHTLAPTTRGGKA
jgi:CelD/BcsL family acetyltransferase involved in cellulose biosynthesis